VKRPAKQAPGRNSPIGSCLSPTRHARWTSESTCIARYADYGNRRSGRSGTARAPHLRPSQSQEGCDGRRRIAAQAAHPIIPARGVRLRRKRARREQFDPGLPSGLSPQVRKVTRSRSQFASQVSSTSRAVHRKHRLDGFIGPCDERSARIAAFRSSPGCWFKGGDESLRPPRHDAAHRIQRVHPHLSNTAERRSRVRSVEWVRGRRGCRR
jgi:hypothetical protein